MTRPNGLTRKRLAQPLSVCLAFGLSLLSTAVISAKPPTRRRKAETNRPLLSVPTRLRPSNWRYTGCSCSGGSARISGR